MSATARFGQLYLKAVDSVRNSQYLQTGLKRKYLLTLFVTGRYGREPAHYEVVIPQKISEYGDFLTHMIPHHYKLSYYKVKRESDMNSYDAVHYMVPIAGEAHHLELLPNTDMASPSLVIETHGEEGPPTIKRAGDIQCYFQGTVKGEKDSSAAISTCHGLVSTLYYN